MKQYIFLKLNNTITALMKTGIKVNIRYSYGQEREVSDHLVWLFQFTSKKMEELAQLGW